MRSHPKRSPLDRFILSGGAFGALLDRLAWLTGMLAALAIALWSATWRIDRKDLARIDAWLDRGIPVLAVFWHGKYLPLFRIVSGRRAMAFIADGFRGRAIATICKFHGYETRMLGENHHGLSSLDAALSDAHGLVAAAVDGPLGPYKSVHLGVIRTAVSHGYRIVPVEVESHPVWRLTIRWDRFEIPLPFARVKLVCGDPVDLQQGSADAYTKWREAVGAALSALLPDAQERAQHSEGNR